MTASLRPAADPALAGRRLITLTLEAMAGRRPLTQVQPMTSPGVYASLAAGRRPRWCADSSSNLGIHRAAT